MPRSLLRRLQPECIREFELAADERFRDATCLIGGDRRTAAIYLFGYVVEMILKARYFRLIGLGDFDAISISTLRQHVGDSPASTARSLGLQGARNLHNLLAWVELIVAYRGDRGISYRDPGFGDMLYSNVIAIHRLWSESLRYHRNIAYPHELGRARVACEWILGNRDAI